MQDEDVQQQDTMDQDEDDKDDQVTAMDQDVPSGGTNDKDDQVTAMDQDGPSGGTNKDDQLDLTTHSLRSSTGSAIATEEPVLALEQDERRFALDDPSKPDWKPPAPQAVHLKKYLEVLLRSQYRVVDGPWPADDDNGFVTSLHESSTGFRDLDLAIELRKPF